MYFEWATLRDQEARVRVTQVVEPNPVKLRPRTVRPQSRWLKLSGSMGPPSGEMKTISLLKRLGSRLSAALSVGTMSMARRDRRDLGETKFRRQSDRRTWMRP